MAKIIRVLGYKAFKKSIEPYNEKNLVYCYFTGNQTEKGVSWCSGCANAEPHVYAALKSYAKENAIFIHADIGNENEFQDNNNPFRLDRDVQLSIIPHLLLWKRKWQLLGGNCCNKDLLKRFFTKEIGP